MIWVKSQEGNAIHECSGVFVNECSLRVFSGEQWNTVGRYDTPEIAQDVMRIVWRAIQSGGNAVNLPINSDGSYTDKIDVTSFEGGKREIDGLKHSPDEYIINFARV